MSKKVNITTMKVEDLKPYQNNPRINEGAIEFVANSIKEFGFKVPIVVDKDNTIVSGHTRWLASKQLGLKEVPVIIADDLTPEQIKAFRIADNKVSEKSSWDFSKLADEIEGLDFDLTEFGFGQFELDVLKNGNDFDEEALDGLFVNAGEKEPKEPKQIKCPHCGAMIEL